MSSNSDQDCSSLKSALSRGEKKVYLDTWFTSVYWVEAQTVLMLRALYTFWQFVTAWLPVWQQNWDTTTELMHYFHSSSPALIKRLYVYGLVTVTKRVRWRPELKTTSFVMTWEQCKKRTHTHTSRTDVKENVELLKMRKCSSFL